MSSLLSRPLESTHTTARKRLDAPRLLNLTGRTLIFICLLLFAILTVGPFLLMLSFTFRPPGTVLRLPIEWLPTELSVEGFRTVLTRSMFLRWFFNSVLVTAITVCVQLFTNSLAGYTFARKTFPGRNLIFWMCMAMIVVPFQITLIPLFVIFARLGLHNNYGGLILISVSSIYGAFLFRQYILGIPRDYDDAARVDGATEFEIYWRVILPQCTPITAVLGAFTFIGMWNSYIWPLLIVTSESMMTLPVGLALLQGLPMGTDPSAQMGQLLAAGTLMTVPTIVVLIVMQRYIIRGVALTGVKG